MILPPKDAGLQQPQTDTEFQQVQAAVLRECIVNLQRIKEAVVQSVGGTLDAAGLDSWQDLMVNETPLVPDLERLEEMIADETSIASA